MVDDLPPWAPSKRLGAVGRWNDTCDTWVTWGNMRFWKIWVMLAFLKSYPRHPSGFFNWPHLPHLFDQNDHFSHSSLSSGGGGTSWWRILGHQDAINSARAERNGSGLVNRGTSSSQSTSIGQSCGHLMSWFGKAYVDPQIDYGRSQNIGKDFIRFPGCSWMDVFP